MLSNGYMGHCLSCGEWEKLHESYCQSCHPDTLKQLNRQEVVISDQIGCGFDCAVSNGEYEGGYDDYYDEHFSDTAFDVGRNWDDYEEAYEGCFE